MPGKTTVLLVATASVAGYVQELSKEALLDFVNTRYQAYFHYNMCTFKNLNSDERHGRTHGDDPANMWNPTGLDCRQWAGVCRAGKLAGGGAGRAVRIQLEGKASLCIAEVVMTGNEEPK